MKINRFFQLMEDIIKESDIGDENNVIIATKNGELEILSIYKDVDGSLCIDVGEDHPVPFK